MCFDGEKAALILMYKHGVSVPDPHIYICISLLFAIYGVSYFDVNCVVNVLIRTTKKAWFKCMEDLGQPSPWSFSWYILYNPYTHSLLGIYVSVSPTSRQFWDRWFYFSPVHQKSRKFLGSAYPNLMKTTWVPWHVDFFPGDVVVSPAYFCWGFKGRFT